jgi:hypothetical protein
MAWSSLRRLARVGDCSCPLLEIIVRGSWPFPVGDRKRYSSGLLVACGSSSCVGCVAPKCGLGVWCLLAREPPVSVSLQRGLARRQASEPRKKNHCVNWYSLWLIFCLPGSIYTPLPLLYYIHLYILCRGSLACYVALLCSIEVISWITCFRLLTSKLT